jgi:hypothetical protein
MQMTIQLNNLTKKELRELIIRARGEFLQKYLGGVGETHIYALGYENNPDPSYFKLSYEGQVIYIDSDIDSLLITDNYEHENIDEDEIDTLSQMTELMLSRW